MDGVEGWMVLKDGWSKTAACIWFNDKLGYFFVDIFCSEENSFPRA